VGRAEPGLDLGWLLGPGSDASALLDEALERGFGGLHPFVASVDAELVGRAQRAGLALRVWTVNSDGDLRAMVDLGVDAVITDRPAEALRVVRTGPNGGAPPG
jgi:glycerophosphoryl diester phosphodiesterase